MPPSKIDHPHRDRLALLIAMAGERPAQVGDVLRVLWPDASIATANRSLHRLITMPGIPFFASIDGAKSLGTRRVVRLTPWPSAVEMFGDAPREAV